jgi:MerR family transcriptional regulator, thiopeptide resistance regulator
MYTVSGLARACGLTRTSILYYESLGLLKPCGRSAGNYRQYGDRELERLREICAYRHVGLSLADIRTVLGRPSNDAASTLQKRLVQIDAEVGRLRGHQRVILRLLGNRAFKRAEMITKDKWVAIMKGAGLSHEQMERWHAEFEHSAPEEHQEFLEFLQIPGDEITKIREWSRKGRTGK